MNTPATLGSTITHRKNNWTLLYRQYTHFQMTMEHSTKFQVSTIGHLGGEESASYFTPSTSLGSTITHRKNNWTLLYRQYTHFQMTSYFTPSTSLGSTITQKKKWLDPPVLTIFISTNDNEVLLKFSSLYDQPSQRRSEHKLFYMLHSSWIHHKSKKNYWILLSWQYADLLMIMKHCTKFQVSAISCLREEVSTRYFISSTSLGSTITQRQIIGFSCHDNMHIC
jgi:hypothetical protein